VRPNGENVGLNGENVGVIGVYLWTFSQVAEFLERLSLNKMRTLASSTIWKPVRDTISHFFSIKPHKKPLHLT
jgi:hypothetical protein